MIIKHWRYLRCQSPSSVFGTQGRVSAILVCPAGGVTGAQEERGEPSAAESNYAPFLLTFLFSWEDRSEVLSSSMASLSRFSLYVAVSFKTIQDPRRYRLLGQCPPPSAELSVGSECGAVGSSRGAATWCGPALLGARWAAADPSCRAASTAQCCDPGSTPGGTPGTETDEREVEIMPKIIRLNPKASTLNRTYLRVHFRVPAPFTLPQTLGLSSL